MLQRPLTKAYITEIHIHYPKGLPFSVPALLATVVLNADDEAWLAACKAAIVTEGKVSKASFIQWVKTFVVHNRMAKEVNSLQYDQQKPTAFLTELSQQVEIGSYNVDYSKNDEPGPLF